MKEREGKKSRRRRLVITNVHVYAHYKCVDYRVEEKERNCEISSTSVKELPKRTTIHSE